LTISKEDISTLAGDDDINCTAITASSERWTIQTYHLTLRISHLHHMAVVEDIGYI
jgi:hypothetical protein